jgi:hypothetical protein
MITVTLSTSLTDHLETVKKHISLVNELQFKLEPLNAYSLDRQFDTYYGGGHHNPTGRPRYLHFFVAMTGGVTGIKMVSSDTL